MRSLVDGFPQRWALIGLAALALLWPAAVNGGAFFTTDSIAYIREPDQAIVKVLGPRFATVWSAKPLGMGFQAGADELAAKNAGKSPPMAGRSIYYGLLANLGARTGGFWLTLLIQALAAACSLDVLCRALGWARRRTFAIVAGLAAFATPLAFFVCSVMPDVWAAIAILVVAAMAAGRERLSRTEKGLGVILLVFAAAAHTTILLLLAGAVGACAILLAWRRRTRVRLGAPGLTAIVALVAIVLGAASGAAFNVAVKKAYGAAPVQPPFLTARLVGDGRPGDAWLRRHCPAAGFQACAYVARLPMPTDDFLWSSEPGRSAFWTASPPERAALGSEQFRFAAAVFRDDPLAVARQVAVDGATQFADISLAEFNHKDSVRASMLGWMVGPDATGWRASLAYRKAWPTGVLDAIETAALLLAGCGLIALAVRSRRPGPHLDETRSRILAAGFVILTMVVANAVVCGGLSDIFGRYQARVTAPLILIGLLALGALGRRAQDRRNDALAEGQA